MKKKGPILGIIIISIIAGIAALASSSENESNLGEQYDADMSRIHGSVSTALGSPILGNPDAPITIVEFGDYQCHQCYNWYHNTKPEITTNYIQTGKVNLVFVDLAFLGRDSPKAAQATYCAEDQGKYWVYHDILYNSQESQIDNGWASSERLKEFASSLDLDMILFESCLDSEKYAERVQFNISQAREHGVRGTPGFFITSFNNQQQLGGAQPFSVFKQVIDSQLNTYTPTQREWIASGPFQIDKSIYAIGEKIFIRIDGLENYDKGTLIVMRPFNSTHYSEYLAIPFDGAQKSSYNYYIEPQISSAKGINSVSDLVGTWTVIFRDTAFENLQFEVTETIVPATNLNEEQWHEDPYADEAAKIRDEWEKNNQIIPKLDAERTFELDFIESSDFRTLAFNALPGEFGHNPEIRVKTGDTIKIVTTNTGKSFHSFGIVADPEKIDDVLWGSEIAAATNPLKPDETKSSTFVVGAPGTYFYICTVPGHTSQGMQGSFIVESTYDQIPDWLDNLFGWYSTNQVSEDELFTALNYLLKNKIIDVTSDEQGLLPKSVLGADLNEEQWHEDPYADEAAKIRDEWEKNNGQ